MEQNEKELENMYERGILSEEEYIKKKNELLAHEKKEVKPQESSEQEPAKEQINKRSDLHFFIAIGIVVILFVGFFGISYALNKPKIITIDELHDKTLEGRLDEDKGYIYNGYSFVKVDNLWYTNVQTIDGSAVFSIPFHYGPREVEDIAIQGSINLTSFSESKEVFMTFNPDGEDFTHVALATGELDQALIKVFGKIPIGSCDREGNAACENRPIVTCNNTKQPIFYILEGTETQVTYNDNCIIMEGDGLEIVRAADRVLLDILGIVKQ